MIFYKNNGDRLSICEHISDKRVIVGFEFIEDELLLVMLNEGTYFLMDPLGKECKKSN